MTRPEYLSANARDSDVIFTLLQRTSAAGEADKSPSSVISDDHDFDYFILRFDSLFFYPIFVHQVLSKMNYSSYFYAVANACNFASLLYKRFSCLYYR